MNIVETEYWCLMLPLEWSAQEEDGVISITDQDGIGELALTTLVREPGELGANTEDALTALVALESPEVKEWAPARFGAFTGLAGRFQDDETQIREWYLGYGEALLYITYICDLEDAGMDDAAIEEILGTLVVGDALSLH
tara:strand:+ start:914 stop:1333 length:420 start_codon:yes stop_codon:yes gene_type:complete